MLRLSEVLLLVTHELIGIQSSVGVGLHGMSAIEAMRQEFLPYVHRAWNNLLLRFPRVPCII